MEKDGVSWVESAGWSRVHMKIYCKWWKKKVPDRNNMKQTEIIVESHNERDSLIRTITEGRMYAKSQDEDQE